MAKFLQDMSTAYWWISVVVVGLILNVLANYLPDITGKLFGTVSGRVRESNKKYWEKIDMVADVCVRKPDEILYRMHRITHDFLLIILGAFLSFSLFALSITLQLLYLQLKIISFPTYVSSGVFVLMAIFITIVSLQTLMRALKNYRVVNRARERLFELEKQEPQKTT